MVGLRTRFVILRQSGFRKLNSPLIHVSYISIGVVIAIWGFPACPGDLAIVPVTEVRQLLLMAGAEEGLGEAGVGDLHAFDVDDDFLDLFSEFTDSLENVGDVHAPLHLDVGKT